MLKSKLHKFERKQGFLYRKKQKSPSLKKRLLKKRHNLV